ncbi:MAG: hypothetical protein K0Q76_1519 [Panacagrimonas sp.]|jgi:hypothetical protein|nr:SHOCT domain-containing protein [Panacagrimonas sp.]MCC2656411.1 hypothetical protein [Panacagrimonas sp.]
MNPDRRSAAAGAPRIVRLGLMWMIGAPLIAFFGIGGILFWIFMPRIGIGQIWVAVSLVLLAVYGVITWAVRRRWARIERLMRDGLSGFATILEAEGTGVAINHRPQVRLRLRVEVPGRAPYEAEVREVLPFLGLESVGPRRRVPVFVDRDDPKRLMIDWSGVGAAAMTSGTDPGEPVDEVAARLEKLQTLRRRGLISQAEFDEQRRRTLDRI